MSVSLKLTDILLDGGTQCRASLDEEHISGIAEAWTDGAKIPPVVVYHNGTSYYLADGFHRYHAAQRAGFADILAEVISGTQQDAIKYALGANVSHGLRRSNADKRRAVEIAVEQFPNLSSRELAKLCGVGHPFVESIRPQFLLESDSSRLQRVGADGKARVKQGGGAKNASTKKAKGTEAIQVPYRAVCARQLKAVLEAQTLKPKLTFEERVEVMYQTGSRDLPHVFGAAKQTEVTIAEIYEAYPRKIARIAALKAIEGALGDHGIEKDALLKLTHDYGAAVSQWPESDRQWIPHPATWFNRGSFLDDQKEWKRHEPEAKSSRPKPRVMR